MVILDYRSIKHLMNSIRVSVCMATYNGRKYIKEQLESILSQISEFDEVIISDDSSSDDTLDIIESFGDNRIIVYRNCFRNVVKNFEFAISRACGDVIFLSDQDDIWHPKKVERYLEQFRNNNIGLVISNLQIIDKNGNPIDRFFFNQGFHSGLLKNIIKNNFIGCSMAFRKEIISKALPFPKNIPMHDWWIGILNLHYGKVLFLNKNLISYRRHNNNVTSESSSNLSKIVSWRNTLFWLFLKRILKNS